MLLVRIILILRWGGASKPPQKVPSFWESGKTGIVTSKNQLWHLANRFKHPVWCSYSQDLPYSRVTSILKVSRPSDNFCSYFGAFLVPGHLGGSKSSTGGSKEQILELFWPKLQNSFFRPTGRGFWGSQDQKCTKKEEKIVGCRRNFQNRYNSRVDQVLRVWASYGKFKVTYER